MGSFNHLPNPKVNHHFSGQMCFDFGYAGCGGLIFEHPPSAALALKLPECRIGSDP